MMHEMVEGFWSSQYAPHGYCLLWRPDLIMTHLISDVLTAAAYFSIPFALIRFVRKRPDIQFSGLFVLFAVFILACGMTHVMGAWNLWHGHYGLAGVFKAITAAASVPTAIVLWRILPQALAVPSPTQLQTANDKLSAMVMERDVVLRRLEQEISERIKAEEALVQVKKIDAMGQLTGGIAHDFNNLLQAISGNIELISRKVDATGKVKKWLESASLSVERGAKLAKQLLIFSRDQRIERSAVDINATISGMEDLIERSIGNGSTIELQLDSDIPQAMTDAHQLELAILNLCINARDAMPEGGGITVRTSRQSAPEQSEGADAAEFVRIDVIDTGTGMEPEVLAKALDPFFTTKEVGKGTGLGLSMAYGFAQQSGGSLNIDSEPGRGTRISIYLPTAVTATNGSDGKEARFAPPPRLLSANARLGTVMLVDDDEDVRVIMVDMLTDIGYAVHDFARPADAIDAIADIGPDIAVIDYMMPEINGAELAKALREKRAEQAILFVSGYSESALLDPLIDERSRVLRKPFTVDELEDVLGRLVASQPVDEESDGQDGAA